jgi:hypothetical protein
VSPSTEAAATLEGGGFRSAPRVEWLRNCVNAGVCRREIVTCKGDGAETCTIWPEHAAKAKVDPAIAVKANQKGGDDGSGGDSDWEAAMRLEYDRTVSGDGDEGRRRGGREDVNGEGNRVVVVRRSDCIMMVQRSVIS